MLAVFALPPVTCTKHASLVNQHAAIDTPGDCNSFAPQGVALDDMVYICTKLARQMDEEGIVKMFDAAQAATQALEDARPLLQQASGWGWAAAQALAFDPLYCAPLFLLRSNRHALRSREAHLLQPANRATWYLHTARRRAP